MKNFTPVHLNGLICLLILFHFLSLQQIVNAWWSLWISTVAQFIPYWSNIVPQLQYVRMARS